MLRSFVKTFVLLVFAAQTLTAAEEGTDLSAIWSSTYQDTRAELKAQAKPEPESAPKPEPAKVFWSEAPAAEKTPAPEYVPAELPDLPEETVAGPELLSFGDDIRPMVSPATEVQSVPEEAVVVSGDCNSGCGPRVSRRRSCTSGCGMVSFRQRYLDARRWWFDGPLCGVGNRDLEDDVEVDVDVISGPDPFIVRMDNRLWFSEGTHEWKAGTDKCKYDRLEYASWLLGMDIRVPKVSWLHVFGETEILHFAKEEGKTDQSGSVTTDGKAESVDVQMWNLNAGFEVFGWTPWKYSNTFNNIDLMIYAGYRHMEEGVVSKFNSAADNNYDFEWSTWQWGVRTRIPISSLDKRLELANLAFIGDIHQGSGHFDGRASWGRTVGTRGANSKHDDEAYSVGGRMGLEYLHKNADIGLGYEWTHYEADNGNDNDVGSLDYAKMERQGWYLQFGLRF